MALSDHMVLQGLPGVESLGAGILAVETHESLADLVSQVLQQSLHIGAVLLGGHEEGVFLQHMGQVGLHRLTHQVTEQTRTLVLASGYYDLLLLGLFCLLLHLLFPLVLDGLQMSLAVVVRLEGGLGREGLVAHLAGVGRGGLQLGNQGVLLLGCSYRLARHIYCFSFCCNLRD